METCIMFILGKKRGYKTNISLSIFGEGTRTQNSQILATSMSLQSLCEVLLLQHRQGHLTHRLACDLSCMTGPVGGGVGVASLTLLCVYDCTFNFCSDKHEISWRDLKRSLTQSTVCIYTECYCSSTSSRL